MNKIYRTVYNETTNTWTAVAEIAKAKGKSKSSKTAVASVAVAGALLSSTAVQAEGLKWGDGATAEGYESIAMGVNSTAKSKYTITLGARAKNETNGEAAVIIGNDAKAIADVNASTAANTMGQQVAIGEASVANSQSVALGAQTYATGQASIAIGGDDLGNNDSKTSAGKYTGADAWRNYAGQPITVEGVTTKDASDPAIGFTSTTASGRGSIALGHMGQSTGKASVAIGADSHAEADGAIAAGMVSQATGAAAVAVGVGAQAKKDHATAIGLKAVASETNSFAAGTNAQASKAGATAVGVDSNALAEHSIAIGSNAKVSQTAPTTTQYTKGVSDASISIGQTSYAQGLAAVADGAK
ncbi:MAG: ESPR-type extended signal peptide-containing protein, partial [Neisseria sp.]